MIRCSHWLVVSTGQIDCELEEGHGQPHQARLGNDTAGADDGPWRYPAVATLVWHENLEV